MAKKARRWSLARSVTSIMALLPVLLLLLVVANLVWSSLPAIQQAGLPVLFSTKISNVFSGVYTPGEFGLLPALWGTLLLAGMTLCMAFPVSLAMAIFATEFDLKGLGRVLEAVLGIFVGLPPILYAVLSLTVLTAFVVPKFGGDGLPEEILRALPGLPSYNAGTLPRETSTLLGGIMLSLLVIPFMAPLIVDAIRGVPHELKEASLALGATRWYTLMRVTLPSALPGIATALSLGTLKTIGDVVISAWTIGYIKNGLPQPLVDIFESIAPLTSTGAGLLNGLEGGAAVPPGPERGAAYFAALLLLLLAFTILVMTGLVQRYLQRRLTR